MLNIKHIRKRLAMSQEDFSKAVGVSQSSVSQWEQGLTHPSFRAVYAIAQLMGVTIEELMAEEKTA